MRFEMIRHEERNRIVLRVLKFLRPHNPSDAVMQKEGELLKKYDPVRKVEAVWMAGRDSDLLKPPLQSALKRLEQTYIANSSP